MNFIEIGDNEPKDNYESFKQEQSYKSVNGQVIEDVNIKEYNKNGEVIIEGNINGEPILYTNTNSPYNEFSKKVHFMDITSPRVKTIVRTKTPYSNRKQTKRKQSKKRKMTKKKIIRKRNK